MLRDFTPRLYQQTILGTAAQFNTLVVLPTGLGKTAIALLLTVQRLHFYPASKILFLAPTKPLCEQHAETFKKHLDIPPEKIVVFTGSLAPEKRAVQWKAAQIIISTPQTVENDLINNRVAFEDVSLLVFDEAHHATGDYAYVWLAEQYETRARYSRILALTASPGSTLEKIKEICQTLKIEKVEVRTEKDPDVQPYVQTIKKNWIPIDFPEEFRKVQQLLLLCKKSKLLEMQKLGFASSAELRKGDLLLLQGDMQKQISSGDRSFELLRSISLAAEALKVEHALELLETQGLPQLFSYLDKIRQESRTSPVKAVKNLVIDEHFKGALALTEQLIEKNIPHPKLEKLLGMVQETLQQQPQAKIIVFTQFRSSADLIQKKLEAQKISTHLFLGQAKKNGQGFSQKQQKEILEQFRAAAFNVLISTSVGEEGIDIPKVDEVIFYEPVPSAIRTIQRRGRTGRLEQGEVNFLVTSGTRDEAYRWTAHHREKRMYRTLEQIKKESAFLQAANKNITLDSFIPEKQSVAILADHREKDNKVVKELIGLGLSVKTAQLQVADYVLSGTVGVELKKVPDFVASIIDGRLLDQVRELKQNFDKAVVIIEGEEDIYAVRQVHANAIRGMLAAIVLDFHVPILYTKNPRDTAQLLAVMARREQDKDRDFSYHARKPRTEQEQQEFIVSSLPGLGVQTARRLLETFGSIKALVNASRQELLEIEGIGEKTADKILGLFVLPYQKKKE
ncbi:MAG TPA: DEAD/DEAH box helicase [Candidatus Nanoarchaeia archaeon]|nr:DEAD/DEAH box helicase [Candidatus Nanoarchaeia archaeon]